MREGGLPATRGGIEFAQERVDVMDLYRAGRANRALKAFVDDLRSALRMRGLRQQRSVAQDIRAQEVPGTNTPRDETTT